jgi:hypothetical protein
LTELSLLSYKEGSRQAKWPSNPQSLATLPTRLCLATTRRMRALQVKFPSNGVCCNFHQRGGGICRAVGELHRLGEVGLVPGGGRAAKPCGRPAEWSSFHRLSPPTRASPPHVDVWQPSFRSNHRKSWPADQGVSTVGQPLGPLGLGSGPTWSTCQIHHHGDDDFDIGQLHLVIP